MATFLKYNTTDPVKPDPAITNGTTIILGGGWNPAIDLTQPNAGPNTPSPSQNPLPVWTGDGLTGTASKIAGSAFSSLGGTLTVEQSFDSINWDIQQAYTIPVNTVYATAPYAIDQDVLAPYLRITYLNTGATPDPTVRIFARIFGAGRNNA